jgi:hypothetical protein
MNKVFFFPTTMRERERKNIARRAAAAAAAYDCFTCYLNTFFLLS